MRSICVHMNFNESSIILHRDPLKEPAMRTLIERRDIEGENCRVASFLDRYISLFFGFTHHKRLITINRAILYRVFFSDDTWHVKFQFDIGCSNISEREREGRCD